MINLQKRDILFLRDLFESRIMAIGHIAILHFDCRREAAKKRLQKLKAAGLIGERKRKAYEPSVLYLTRKAIAALKTKGVLAEYPTFEIPSLERRAQVREVTVRHELEVMDVKTAFHSAMKTDAAFSIVEFSTWPLLHQFEASRNGFGGGDVTVKPDGFIRIHEKEADGGLSEHAFFLELDRSTETQDTLVTRAGCYLNFYHTGGFAVRNGGERHQFKEYPFRVLIVLKTAERRNNTAERLLQSTPPILRQVCLSTFNEVTTNPLGRIWITPADYRDATKGTPFDTEKKRETWGYKRQTEREILVETKIKKSRILTDPA